MIHRPHSDFAPTIHQILCVYFRHSERSFEEAILINGHAQAAGYLRFKQSSVSVGLLCRISNTCDGFGRSLEMLGRGLSASCLPLINLGVSRLAGWMTALVLVRYCSCSTICGMVRSWATWSLTVVEESCRFRVAGFVMLLLRSFR